MPCYVTLAKDLVEMHDTLREPLECQQATQSLLFLTNVSCGAKMLQAPNVLAAFDWNASAVAAITVGVRNSGTIYLLAVIRLF